MSTGHDGTHTTDVVPFVTGRTPMGTVTNIRRDNADEINAEHKLARSDAQSAVQHAIRCGELLIAQKEALAHGEFKPWIEAHCEFSYPSAAVYMKAAKQKSRGLDFSSLAGLIATNKPKPKAVASASAVQSEPATSQRKAKKKPEPKSRYSWIEEFSSAAKLSGKESADSRRQQKFLAWAKQEDPALEHRNPEHVRRLRTLAERYRIVNMPVSKLENVSATARAEVEETKRERFDRLVSLAIDAKTTLLLAQFNEQVCIEVDKRVGARTTALNEQENALKELRSKVHELEESVVPLITEAEAKIITGCLHPDRPDRSAEQLARAFAIWKRVVDRRTVRYTKDVLRKYGWSH